MPRIVCHSCGREIYTTAPIDQLFADERRCPRCGAFLQEDHRKTDRRAANRRADAPESPGPPEPVEHRVAERRKAGRRKADGGPDGDSSTGWIE